MRKYFIFNAVLLVASHHCVNADDFVCRNGTDFISEDGAELNSSLDKYEGALLLLLGFGGFSIFLAVIYNFIRRYVFEDVNSLDSAFDAGGNVSTSLTAVTIASQFLWPGDILQSVTVCVKYGIAGAFWYSGTVVVNAALFPLLSTQFKTKSPGAKTVLQIIRARFGTATHSVFIFFALLVNVVILGCIFVGDIAVLQATIKDISPEFCVLVLATLCGSYSLIGGLGSTFYVSYFNAVVTFLTLCILIIRVLYADDHPLGSLEEIYQRVNCHPGIHGNQEGSRFTFLSRDSFIYACQSLFLASSIIYCDQASWQSRIAAKPLQGALGFLFGSLFWFSVPSSIGLVTGIAYLSETARNESLALSIKQIDSGIVSAYMAEKAMGSGGGIMILTMLTMLTMSTGSGEIMGVTSVIVYDIYQIYIRPFRPFLPSTHCLCCGLEKSGAFRKLSPHNHDSSVPMCICPPAVNCYHCKNDLERFTNAKKFPGKVVKYSCPHHGIYRMYQDSLINFKNWCVLWVSVGLIPFGLFLNAIELDLNWTMLTGIVFTVPSFPGFILSILWVKTTSKGMLTGSITGFISGTIANLLVSILHYEWKGGFIQATSAPYSVLAGCSTGFFVSLILIIIVSLATHEIQIKEDEAAEWQKLRDIDNPLHPWSLQYAEEFPEAGDGSYRPSEEEMVYRARHGKYVSLIGGIVLTCIFIIIVPTLLASLEVLSLTQFRVWTVLITSFLFISTIVIIVTAPFEEIRAVITQLRKKRKKDKNEQLLALNTNVANETKSSDTSGKSLHCPELVGGKVNRAFQSGEKVAKTEPSL